jgi:uncharacterized protein (DUF488 family)
LALLFWIMSVEPTEVCTIGHSSHSQERFMALLRGAGVTAIADVRTAPYSRRHPHFNREALRAALQSEGIAYVYLGRELGGRPSAPELYSDGVADYERMAQAGEFAQGLDRVIEGARTYRIALMCSEREPLHCHRCLLVSRALAQRGVRVSHILDDGLVSQAEIEDRLLAIASRDSADLFASRAERLAAAYREYGRKVAFAEPEDRAGASGPPPGGQRPQP